MYSSVKVRCLLQGLRVGYCTNSQALHLSFFFRLGLFYTDIYKMYFFLRFYFYLFLERWESREKERERNINMWLPLTHPLLGTWPATQACVLTGNPTRDPLFHRPALNPLSHTSQG